MPTLCAERRSLRLGVGCCKISELVHSICERREAGGSIDLITAVKMAYLADRRFMELRDLPILNDDRVSMEHGPVDSETYNYIRGEGGASRYMD
jgi:hypothetical protein